MRNFLLITIFASVGMLISGCASPRQSYVSAHPDLPAEHRRILLSGKISYADPVVGMTKDEIRLTMGSEPAKAQFIEGEEAWIWVREKTSGQTDLRDPTSVESVDAGSQAARRSSGGSTSPMIPPEKKQVKTTVFFHGDRANRAQIDEEPL